MNALKPDILNNYLRHSEINNYLQYLSYRYRSFVNVFTIGKTHEGRTIKAIQIDWNKKSKVNSLPYYNISKNLMNDDWVELLRNNQKSNYTLIEAGTHAREWTTVVVALHCIYQLTEKHTDNMNVLKKMKFLIIPLVNADGYEYSHITNNKWRKNRRPIPNCKYIGTDCNRNYDIYWGDGETEEFKSTFRGDRPFSEPETCAIRRVLNKLGKNLKFFLSLHAHAQSIMYPWGYTKKLPKAWKQLHYVAMSGRNAIEDATGTRYRCGSISSLTKRTYSGSVVDYVYDVKRVPYSIVMELASARLGFQPPKEQIGQIAAESWIGIKEMCDRVCENLESVGDYRAQGDSTFDKTVLPVKCWQ